MNIKYRSDAQNFSISALVPDWILQKRVLGEVAKKSFIALPGNGGHSGLLPLKTVWPNLGGFNEFYSNGSRAALW